MTSSRKHAAAATAAKREMAAIGDRRKLPRNWNHWAARSQAQEEYDALALALEELDRANTDFADPFFALDSATGPARSSTPLPADAISMYS